jgi:hypothetical protein
LAAHNAARISARNRRTDLAETAEIKVLPSTIRGRIPSAPIACRRDSPQRDVATAIRDVERRTATDDQGRTSGV